MAAVVKHLVVAPFRKGFCADGRANGENNVVSGFSFQCRLKSTLVLHARLFLKLELSCCRLARNETSYVKV